MNNRLGRAKSEYKMLLRGVDDVSWAVCVAGKSGSGDEKMWKKKRMK